MLGHPEFKLISFAWYPVKLQVLDHLSSLNLYISLYLKWLLTGQLHSLKLEVFLFVLTSVLGKLGFSQ